MPLEPARPGVGPLVHIGTPYRLTVEIEREVSEAWKALDRGPGEDDAGRVETLAQAIRAEMERRDAVVVAFIKDRREQYVPSSGSYDALCELVARFERGEHREAFEHGELDDLLERGLANG